MTKLIRFFGLPLLLSPALSAFAADDTLAQQRAQIRKEAQKTLQLLYSVQPSARGAVEKAYGYAVFSTFGMKILFAGGGSGKGFAVSRDPKREIFMKMAQVQAGLGFGIKETQLVFVFLNREAFSQFVDSGWEMSGQGSVAATDGGQGLSLDGSVAVSPGVWLYQITGRGLAAQLTISGTKYYRDDELN